MIEELDKERTYTIRRKTTYIYSQRTPEEKETERKEQKWQRKRNGLYRLDREVEKALNRDSQEKRK